MSQIALSGAVEAGLIYGLVAMAVYLSFRVLDFPDLTVDGSFPLGAAVAATAITSGVPPVLATLMAALAGAGAGYVTGFLSVRLKIMNLLAGILVMVALYSINLRIMGRPNISLYGTGTIFTWIDTIAALGVWGNSILLLVIAVAAKFGLDWFLGTELGLALRATGANPQMAEAQGVNNGRMILMGMALSNGLAALAGALYAESQGVADVTMGIGTIVIGLAALIIGETLFGRSVVARITLGCFAGAIAYRMVIAVALDGGTLGIQAQDLNLVTAVVVAVAVVVSQSKMRPRRRHSPAAKPTEEQA